MTTVAHRQRSHRSADTEMTILEIARDLLAEGGLERLSMRAVAQRAGVSATAIYHYFTNKQELVERVVELGFHRFDEHLQMSIAAHPVGSLERLTALGEAYIQFALDNRQHFQVIFNIETSNPKAIEDLPGHGGYNLLNDCVRDAMASGAIKPGDPDLIALYLWSLVHGVVTLTLVCQLHENLPRGSNGAPGTPAELLKQFAPFIRQGLEAVATPAAVPATNNKF